MAAGRILKKQISLSEAVNDVSLQAALLFTWAITHADDFGRMLGSPRRVKAQVVPMREDFTAEDVAVCLAELHQTGLICWYAAAGEQYIQFPTWDVHQSGLHKRTASKIPEPSALCLESVGSFPEIPGSSENPLASRARAEPNGTEQNGIESEPEQEEEQETEDIPPVVVTAPEREAADLWARVVAESDKQASRHTTAAVHGCRPLRIAGSFLEVETPPSFEDRERLGRWYQVLQRILCEIGSDTTLSFVTPEHPTRGP